MLLAVTVHIVHAGSLSQFTRALEKNRAIVNVIIYTSAFHTMQEVNMCVAEKANQDIVSAVKRVKSIVVISELIVLGNVILPGMMACHTNTGCKKQTTDIME